MPESLPTNVLTSNRLDEVLANAYVFCRDHFGEIHAATRVGGPYRKRYRRVRGELRDGLLRDCDFLALRQAEGIATALAGRNREEELAGIAALLTAGAAALSDRTNQAARFCRFQIQAHRSFGGESFWISTAPADSMWERYAQPRSYDEISVTVARYHPGLAITAARNGETEIRVERLESRLWSRLAGRAGRLKVAVAPLGRYETRFRVSTPAEHGDPCGFVMESVAEEERQKEEIRQILQQAHGKGVAILTFPELRMTPGLLDVVRDFLEAQAVTAETGLLLVAAGSWHVEDGEAYVNQCPVLDCRGGIVWRQNKLAEFHLSPGNVAKTAEYWRERGVGPEGAVEDIRNGSVQVAVDSPVGRIAVAICAGYLHERAAQLLAEVHANLFLVPAMTTTCRDLEKTAEEMIRRRAGTFVANCGYTGGKHGRSFYLPAQRNGAVERIEEGGTLLVGDFSDSLGDEA
jgi:predicted amidohydrolase